jgi:hypothetical protein
MVIDPARVGFTRFAARPPKMPCAGVDPQYSALPRSGGHLIDQVKEIYIDGELDPIASSRYLSSQTSSIRNPFLVSTPPVCPAWAIIGFPLVFGGWIPELCPHRRNPALEDSDDVVADLGRREGGSVYQPSPTIDFILGTDDHLIGIAIHRDEALGLLDLLHQISDGHDLVSITRRPRFIP